MPFTVFKQRWVNQSTLLAVTELKLVSLGILLHWSHQNESFVNKLIE